LASSGFSNGINDGNGRPFKSPANFTQLENNTNDQIMSNNNSDGSSGLTNGTIENGMPFKSPTNFTQEQNNANNNSNSGYDNIFDADLSKISISGTDDSISSVISASDDYIIGNSPENITNKRIQYGLILVSVGLVLATVAMLLIRRRRSRTQQALEVYQAVLGM
jgi:hypothetical protein